MSTETAGQAQVGVMGLAVMGSNLARNFASRGHTVALFNRTQARNVYATIFDPLLHYDDKSQIQAHLATEWGWTDDLTLRITIRTDVKFHDGAALTADDVVYTFQQAAVPRRPHSTHPRAWWPSWEVAPKSP